MLLGNYRKIGNVLNARRCCICNFECLLYCFATTVLDCISSNFFFLFFFFLSLLYCSLFVLQVQSKVKLFFVVLVTSQFWSFGTALFKITQFLLLHSDGKRPDGVTMVPWKQGKPLVCDATCPDTLAPSYRDMASIRTGAVAAAAEERKVAKYMALGHSHSFTPVAIETLGAIGLNP